MTPRPPACLCAHTPPPSSPLAVCPGSVLAVVSEPHLQGRRERSARTHPLSDPSTPRDRHGWGCGPSVLLSPSEPASLQPHGEGAALRRSRISPATPGGLPVEDLGGGPTLRLTCAHAYRLRRCARAPATGHPQCAGPRGCEGPRARFGTKPACGTRPGVAARRRESRLCLRSTQAVSLGRSLSTRLLFVSAPPGRSGQLWLTLGSPGKVTQTRPTKTHEPGPSTL